MKLSEQIYNDFLKESTILAPGVVDTRVYGISHSYLIDLIEKVNELEYDSQKLKKIDSFCANCGHQVII